MSIIEEISKTIGEFVSTNKLKGKQYKLYIVHGNTEYNLTYNIDKSYYCMECYLAEGLDNNNKILACMIYKKESDDWKYDKNLVSITVQDMMVDLSSMQRKFILNLDTTEIEAGVTKKLGLTATTQTLEIEYKNKVERIKMPWCAMACIESVMKYIQKSKECEAVNTAELLGKPCWESLIPYSIASKLDKAFATDYISIMPIRDDYNKDEYDEYTKKYREFEDVLLKDFKEYECYFKYSHAIDSSNKSYREQVSSLFGILSINSTWYTDSKAKRYREMRNAVDSRVCRMLFISVVNGGKKEDSNHTILIDGYTEDGLLILDSNNLTKRHIVVRMLKDTEEVQIAYSPEHTYRIDNVLHIITTTSEVNSEKVNNVLDNTEYKVIRHILNKIERTNGTYMMLSRDKLLDYFTATKLHKKNELIWNYISNIINIRGYESTTSEDLRESSIKNKLDSGKQIIWLCKRYKAVKSQIGLWAKGDLVGTYTLHCREYTKNNFICTGFIGNNEIEIQIPINKTTPKYQIYLSALGRDYICEYVKTLII